eukprot:6202659-Pleurochrysis_carterae.AAC.1
MARKGGLAGNDNLARNGKLARGSGRTERLAAKALHAERTSCTGCGWRTRPDQAQMHCTQSHNACLEQSTISQICFSLAQGKSGQLNAKQMKVCKTRAAVMMKRMFETDTAACSNKII